MKTCLTVWLVLPLVLSGFAMGCASVRKPEVYTWRDSQFAPSPASKLALTDRTNPSPEDARLGRMVVAELKQEGFTLVPVDQADYLLTYVLEHNVEEDNYHPMVTEIPSMPTPQMPGYSPAPVEVLQDQPFSVTVRPNIYPTKDIRLYLYTNPKTHGGSFELAWQGTISQGKSVPAGNELPLVKTLLRYLGKNQNGPVHLTR